jgi:DNA-binding GntR family transcriptional regulator
MRSWSRFYIETDVLFTHSPHDRHAPLLAAARAPDGAALGAAIGAHLHSNQREVARSLESILGTADPDPDHR